MKAAFELWWQARAPRERLLLSLAAGILLIAILYSVLWAPAMTGRAQLRQSLPAMQLQLAQMQAQAQEARSLSSVAASVVPTGGALREALASSLNDHGINGATLTVIGTAVQVQLNNASFASWVGWLDDVRKRFKVQIAEAHVNARQPDGQVDINATLRPAANQS